jgi:DNA-binding MarR family transcriptional regulator
MKNTLANHTESIVLQFLETAHTLEREMDRALSFTRGISFSEYRLLRALTHVFSGNSARIDLANAVGLSASAVTRALKPMEKLGYITTEKSDRDARQSRAVITMAGRELLDDAQGVLHDLFKELPLNTRSQQEANDFRNRLSELRRQR